MDGTSIAIQIGASVLTIGGTVLGAYLASVKAQARFQATTTQQLATHSNEIRDLKKDQTSQWDTIAEHTADIGYLKGRVNGGAHSPHSRQ